MTRRALGFVAGMALVLLPLVIASAQEPPANPHGDAKLDCASCHTAEGWRPLRKPLEFDHARTGFPLVDAHAQAGCRDCHASLVFREVGSQCSDCHRDAHRGELGADCDSCHAPRSWTNRREMFVAHQRTRFPLVAAHARLDCESCHRGKQPREFVGTATECVACHRADYEAAADPDHDRLGFSTDCRQCHAVASNAWRGGTFPGSFPHPATFPLRGAHASVSCAACHVNGRFAGTPRECVACHRDDYDRTSNPNHRASGFPTTCEGCHSTSAWTPASFDHDRFFPLRGDHGGIACATCHVNPGNFALFSCTNCHEHRREEMDKKHDDVRGYSFDSAACYRCHPRGTER